MYMEGTAFPIGTLNKNGWGLADIPTVIESAINSLKASKVRICPINDDSEHFCDFNNDDTTNIGNVIDAWRDDDNIKIKLKITNENAIEKFNSNEFGMTWSPYGFAKTIDDDGFIRDEYVNKSITFVSNPAWNETYGNPVSAAIEKKVFDKELQSYIELQASEIFEDKNMPDNENKEENSNIDEQDEPVINETIKRLEEMFNTEKTRNDTLSEQLQKLIKETPDEPDINEEKESGDGNIPENTVNEMISNAIIQERENVQKEVAIENYKQTCDSIKLEVKSEDLERFSDSRFKAKDINRELESIKSVYSKFNKTPIGVENEPTYSGKTNEKQKNPEDFQNIVGWTVGTPEMWDKE